VNSCIDEKKTVVGKSDYVALRGACARLKEEFGDAIAI
jgi:hypothetical protein